MSKLFIFGIGGTGERVLRSFTMLLASGVESFDGSEIYPIIFDYDANAKDKQKSVKVIKAYQEIHDCAFQRLGLAQKQFFAAKIMELNGLSNFVLEFKPEDDKKKFRDHIGYNNLAGDTYNTKKLLDTLYDNSNSSTTELNLDMTVGFKGNPNIGSVVFRDLSETNEYGNFLNAFKPDNGDKVIVIGSLFGGTGASGVPELVQAIRRDKPDAQIGTILVLPYFHPARKKGGVIDARRFNEKTKAAISYYNDSQLFDKIAKVYYVGDPYPTTVPYSEGGQEQENNANLVELIASFMIKHFWLIDGGDRNKEYMFSIPKNIVINQDDQTKSTRLFSQDLDQGTQQTILNEMKALAIALKFHTDEVLKKTDHAKDTDFANLLSLYATDANENEGVKRLHDLKDKLKTFYYFFDMWLSELDFPGEGDARPANSHRLALFNMKNSYNQIVVAAPKPVTTKKRFSLSPNKGSADIPDFITAQMNTALKSYCEGNILKHGEQQEFIYMDILRKACTNAVTKKY